MFTSQPFIATHPGHSHRSGQTLVEFALVIPLLLTLLLGLMEFGRAIITYIEVTNAAQEAARYGTIAPADTTGIRTKVISAATLPELTPANIGVACAPCTSGNPITVTVRYTFTSAVLMVTPDIPLRTAAVMFIQ